MIRLLEQVAYDDSDWHCEDHGGVGLGAADDDKWRMENKKKSGAKISLLNEDGGPHDFVKR